MPEINANNLTYQPNMQDGHPPLGWHDTICYLVLPVLLVASQYVSMEIMKPPQVDASLYILSFVIVPIIHCDGLTCDLWSATER
jgi:hypothetical protein